MPAAETAILTLEILALSAGLVAVAYGFYTGTLPDWLRRQIGFEELRDGIDEVKTDTERLRRDHEETIDEIETLKTGQVAIAEAVAEEHDSVKVERLRSEHFGDDASWARDFLRGGGDDD